MTYSRVDDVLLRRKLQSAVELIKVANCKNLSRLEADCRQCEKKEMLTSIKEKKEM